MAEFYSARGWEIPPLPWTNLSPPFSSLCRSTLPRPPYSMAADTREHRMDMPAAPNWLTEGLDHIWIYPL